MVNNDVKRSSVSQIHQMASNDSFPLAGLGPTLVGKLFEVLQY